MKKYLLFVVSIYSLLIVYSCKSIHLPVVQTKEVVPTDASTLVDAHLFSVDTSKSFVYWEGRQGVARIITTHKGSFTLQSGAFLVKNNQLVGGKFVIAITSLKNFDLKNTSRKKVLEDHLKSEDFFDAARFPTAQFELTSTEKLGSDSLQIRGNFTLKGITKNIAFPAKVIITDRNVNAHARFYINRKDWGVNWRSEASFGDGIIRDEVGIELAIVTQ